MGPTGNAYDNCAKAANSSSIRRPALLAVGLVFLLTPAAPAAGAASPPLGHVEGVVLAAATRRPAAGATVALPDEGVSTTSSRDGSFHFGRPLPTDDPYR